VGYGQGSAPNKGAGFLFCVLNLKSQARYGAWLLFFGKMLKGIETLKLNN
jgi:hypothetical protein